MTNENPLADLLVDAQDWSRKVLADALAPYAGIDDDTARIMPKKAYSVLTNDKKIIVGLLGRKAARALGVGSFQTDGVAAKELSAITGVKYDSVKPTLTRLRREGIIRTVDGFNEIPDGHVHEAAEMLGSED